MHVVCCIISPSFDDGGCGLMCFTAKFPVCARSPIVVVFLGLLSLRVYSIFWCSLFLTLGVCLFVLLSLGPLFFDCFGEVHLFLLLELRSDRVLASMEYHDDLIMLPLFTPPSPSLSPSGLPSLHWHYLEVKQVLSLMRHSFPGEGK